MYKFQYVKILNKFNFRSNSWAENTKLRIAIRNKNISIDIAMFVFP